MDNEERYRLISESTNDGIWEEVDNNRFFSDRWFEKTGYTREDIQNIGDWKSLIHTEDIGDVLRIVEDHKQLRTPFYACEYRFKLKNGSYIWLLARGKAQFNDEGKVTRMAGSHTDITDIKLYQERLQYLAYNDVLTNLPNRLSLYENATNQFFQNANSKLALLFIDADNFKLYNDTLGHAFGDQLIKQVGERLTSLLKENCFIYRLGGDEFLIILQNLKRKSDAEKFSSDILEGFNKALKIENSILHISISVGISIYPEHGKNIEELMKCADIAMYKAKEEGRNKYVLYDKSMNDDIVDRVNIEKCLRTSLKKNEFELYYQPQLDVENYKITGFEALLRWNSPELGFVSPSRFIKIAEDTHFIIQLGTWILRNACAFLKRLHEQGYNELTISVNISIIQLLQKDFVNIVMDALNINLLDTKYLELEITETVLIESYESIKEKLKDLREKGVLVALDDFGIGYSSLSYLKQLPISTLKIDKSFVDHISSEEKNKGLTGQIISIGKTMGLCVVAEGVETKEQLECLIKYRCTKFQGYYFSKALPEEEVFNLLDKAQN
jgi:diguanylate cyclase (GGDEF)-like protein/PAS domain S-box-containing protein